MKEIIEKIDDIEVKYPKKKSLKKHLINRFFNWLKSLNCICKSSCCNSKCSKNTIEITENSNNNNKIKKTSTI